MLLGVGKDDGPDDVKYVAAKIRDIRVFDGEAGKGMDRSVADIGGSVLVVSQFTLYGDVRKGRRPSFDSAAPPDGARALYEDVVRELRAAAGAGGDRRVPGDDARGARQRRSGDDPHRQQTPDLMSSVYGLRSTVFGLTAGTAESTLASPGGLVS